MPGLRAEEELRELKAQLEEAGFSSISHIRQEPPRCGSGRVAVAPRGSSHPSWRRVLPGRRC